MIAKSESMRLPKILEALLYNYVNPWPFRKLSAWENHKFRMYVYTARIVFGMLMMNLFFGISIVGWQFDAWMYSGMIFATWYTFERMHYHE